MSRSSWSERAKADANRARRAGDRHAVADGFRECHCGDPPPGLTAAPGWRTRAVLGLARYLDETHDYSALPVLADALEEAGCDAPAVLGHCRYPARHVRGCWVIDLLL